MAIRKKQSKQYRSGLEESVAKLYSGRVVYEPFAITYPVMKECKYTPDFIPRYLDPDTMRTIFVECKGRFRDRAEAEKYLHIRKSLPEQVELVFCFQNPGTPFPDSKKRKDGTKFTMGDWADKHGFRHCVKETLDELLKEVE